MIKGQSSTCRGRQGVGIRSGSEPAKALIRGLLLPRPPSFQGQLGSYQSCDPSGESAQAGPCLWPSRGIRGMTSDGPVGEGESAGGELGVGLCLPSRSLRPVQRVATLPQAVPASITRGTLPRPGLDLLDPSGTRGDGVTMRPICHSRIRRSDMCPTTASYKLAVRAISGSQFSSSPTNPSNKSQSILVVCQETLRRC